MVMETRFLDQGFRLETQDLSGWRTALDLGFLTGNPEIAGEIQILRQVFRMETQILIVISSPEQTKLKLNVDGNMLDVNVALIARLHHELKRSKIFTCKFLFIAKPSGSRPKSASMTPNRTPLAPHNMNTTGHPTYRWSFLRSLAGDTPDVRRHPDAHRYGSQSFLNWSLLRHSCILFLSVFCSRKITTVITQLTYYIMATPKPMWTILFFIRQCSMELRWNKASSWQFRLALNYL